MDYEFFCGKTAEVYSDVWKGFKYKIHELSVL